MSNTSRPLAQFFDSQRRTPGRRRPLNTLCASIESLESRVLLSGVTAPPAEISPAGNTPPVAVVPFTDVSVNENAADSVFNLSTMFTDAQDAVLTFRVELNSNPGLVSTTISGPTLTLDFAASRAGSAFIVVRAIDSGGLHAESAFAVTVRSNSAPTVANPVDDVVVDEDADNTVIDLSAVFADAEDQQLTLTVQANSNGELVDATIDGGQLTLDYAADASGTAQITLRATDSGGKFVETTFLVTVNAVNDDPTVVAPISDVTVDEGTESTVIDLSQVFADVEDGGQLTLSVHSNSNGELVNAAIDGNTLTLTYAAGHSGAADITIRATDSSGAFVDTTFQATVNPGEDDGDCDDRRNEHREFLLQKLHKLFSLLRNRGRAWFFWGFGWRR